MLHPQRELGGNLAFVHHLITPCRCDVREVGCGSAPHSTVYWKSAIPAQLVGLADAVLAWFAGHPGFEAARRVFVEMLGAAVAPIGPGVKVPEAFLEVRNLLATRMETWMEQARQQWLLEGEHHGEQRGEATSRLRLLERRFRILPEWARDRVLAADTAVLAEWGPRVLDAARLEEVLA